MLSEMLKSVGGLGGLSPLGLIIFVSFFVMVTIRVIRMDKSLVKYMSNLPIDSSESASDKEDK